MAMTMVRGVKKRWCAEDLAPTQRGKGAVWDGGGEGGKLVKAQGAVRKGEKDRGKVCDWTEASLVR